MRLAFADTRYYVGDPAHGQVPVAELLSREYAQRRAALINQQPNVAFPVENGQPVNTCDTVSLCVVDEHGNACSFINSVYESTLCVKPIAYG
jgi:gamma-glutamyltranspeptidase/glutathione hydrolase